MKAVDDAIFNYECGKMLGAKTARVCFPESVHAFAVKELVEKYNATLDFFGIDNNAIYAEPVFVYSMSLPEEVE